MMAAFEGKKPEPVQETKPAVEKKPVPKVEPKAEAKKVEEEKQAPPKSAR